MVDQPDFSPGDRVVVNGNTLNQAYLGKVGVVVEQTNQSNVNVRFTQEELGPHLGALERGFFPTSLDLDLPPEEVQAAIDSILKGQP